MAGTQFLVGLAAHFFACATLRLSQDPHRRDLLLKKAADQTVIGQHQEAGEINEAQKFFAMNCTMTLATKDGPALWLETLNGKMILTPAGVIKAGKNIGDRPPHPLICESVDIGAQGASTAIFRQATGTSYLFDKHRKHQDGQWQGFLNQYCYAKKHGIRLFLWIGNVDKESIKFLKHRPPDAAPCAEESRPSNHYFRPIAIRAILDENPTIRTIVNMDLDAWIPDRRFSKNIMQEFFEEKEDIVIGAPSYEVLANCAIVGFRNTAFSKHFLADWFKNRCGFKDQLSFWNTLLARFKKKDPAFSWDPNKTMTYKSAEGHVSEVVAAHFPQYRAYADKPLHLTKAIHLPHMIIQPNAGEKPMRFSKKAVPYICHRKKTALTRSTSSSCNFKKICALKEQCNCSLPEAGLAAGGMKTLKSIWKDFWAPSSRG
eukprot:gnl/TRDRNA2_/TRDRNA2_40067_c0_seq1.p1 gnl/TRDRNA2_/TRDRNA2_40067_c0~~gnl/TRDRNA2_/TRDRNA2_40067_c0_seq1.p1  ORF type:complete len:430 (-),score=66.52 gnl/TRDRNA2_/TRDRNA2_40067_c0_seq1:122-1411(-)